MRKRTDRVTWCQRCRPSNGVGSGRPVYPSRPVMRPDSPSSSIRRLCRNTPSGGLVGAASRVVASVYGHFPFGADSAPGGDHQHGVLRICSHFHSHFPFGT